LKDFPDRCHGQGGWINPGGKHLNQIALNVQPRPKHERGLVRSTIGDYLETSQKESTTAIDQLIEARGGLYLRRRHP
ncbi:MAG: hypothetical protein PVF55_06045, partial [Desulfobacterales bacterium]